jgi:hypothetical protein
MEPYMHNRKIFPDSHIHDVLLSVVQHQDSSFNITADVVHHVQHSQSAIALCFDADKFPASPVVLSLRKAPFKKKTRILPLTYKATQTILSYLTYSSNVILDEWNTSKTERTTLHWSDPLTMGECTMSYFGVHARQIEHVSPHPVAYCKCMKLDRRWEHERGGNADGRFV